MRYSKLLCGNLVILNLNFDGKYRRGSILVIYDKYKRILRTTHYSKSKKYCISISTILSLGFHGILHTPDIYLKFLSYKCLAFTSSYDALSSVNSYQLFWLINYMSALYFVLKTFGGRLTLRNFAHDYSFVLIFPKRIHNLVLRS